MYKPKCGITNLTMSWGHDEYLYRVLKHNKSRLPEHALHIIRYHSFYPWHTSRDYQHFEVDGDRAIMNWVNIFKYVCAPKAEYDLVYIYLEIVLFFL